MHILNANTPGIAWKNAFELVLNNGKVVYDGDIKLKEVLDLFVEVQKADCGDLFLKRHSDPQMIDWMVNKNFGGNKPILNWGYCYGMRLRNFKGVNQINAIIKRLKDNPDCKSATLTLMDPETDFQGHMPCIVSLDIKLRRGMIYITGFFRSQDIGKKFYADIMALGSIQKYIAKKLKAKCGAVKIFISSAHIYEGEFCKFANKVNV